MKRVWFVGALALAAALLAACGNYPHKRTAAPEGGAAWISCAAALKSVVAKVKDLPLLSDDFVPVSVVTCDDDVVTNPDGGQDRVVDERRGDGIDSLVAALRRPDEPHTDGNCTMEERIVRWFALIDANGRWVRPGVPVDACGKVHMEVVGAANALKLTDVSRAVTFDASDEAAALGCDQQSSNLVKVETTARSGRTWITPVTSPFASGVALRVCVYAVPAERLVSGVVLEVGWTAAFAEAMATTTPASACDTPGSRFAVVTQGEETGARVHVEIDGCRRVMVEPGGTQQPQLGRANDTLLKLVT